MNSEVLSLGSSLLEVESFLGASNGAPRVSVADMISSRAAQTPLAPAVVSEAGSLSFLDLETRANALAVHLGKTGLRSNQPVGIYFESSIEFVVAALGVWKAGGAYMPIDPAYPADRAAYIMSDSGAPVLVTRRGLSSALVTGPWTTVCLEDLPAADSAVRPSQGPVDLTDLAYIIYTSGSTGQPKGVEITHANLLNLVDWHVSEFSVKAEDRATQIAGPGFDAAVWELWPYLAVGASIHFPSREARLSASQLRDWLVSKKITVSFVPTVLAEEILNLKWPANTDLRFLLTGGDALHSFPPSGLPFRLVNNYGPTECTVVATSATVDSAYAENAAPAIGRAILNTTIRLLDETGREVADGEPGEIYIGGRSVGRGYRNRPDLTAERFVEMAISGQTERLFRTGDLARRLADGQLAFVGRADDQIKIRGFRIEPDEIACVINRHPAVASSCVIARSDNAEKKLVAYVVPATGAEIWDRDLRDLLTRQLPDYMIPASFVALAHIPVTPNGKLDKAALPAPTEMNQLRRDTYVAPRNEVEEIVEGILSPILGLERVSIHDNFFLLGGHSLMGAQVIAKVRDIFDVELILRNVFECPTVAKLSAKIEAALTARLEAMSEEEVEQALRRQPAASTSVLLPSTLRAV
jgi:amino acid adenylation domain-containing protein